MNSQTQLNVLYQDEHLIAVHKPSGIFVHPSDCDRSDTTSVMSLLRDQLNTYVYPVHRLDRATSGVVVMALHRDAASVIGRAFSERHVQKVYRAVVRGFCDDAGQICDPLVPARGRGLPASHPHAEPQEAQTHYRTIARFELPMATGQHRTTRASLVDVYPQTGRYHQIRRHFNYISHPVIGDTSHGDSRHNTFYRTHLRLTRLMLAAVEIELAHPVSGQSLRITAPPERSFSVVEQQLRVHQVFSHSDHGNDSDG